MEGRGERHDAKRAEPRGQRLGALAHEVSVLDVQLGSATFSLRDHPPIGVETDDLGEQMREEERRSARTASGIEQSTAAVEPERVAQRVSDSGRVGRSPLLVVGRAPLEQRLVPFPRLPRHAWSLRGQ